jgi:thiol-disulfide isomerase/thioredoxin
MNIWIILIGLIIITGISYYIYNNKIDTSIFIPNDEYRTDDSLPEGDIILFYVNWCPHSQTALTTWNNIKKKYNNKNYIINFSEIECDKNPDLANEYSIKEYPTIILVKNKLNYEFDANLTETSLNLFINTVMKN